MNETCGNCKHYIRHYIKGGPGDASRFFPLNCGHCCHPRIKNRNEDAKACTHWQARPSALD